jgi:hypothetical protein
VISHQGHWGIQHRQELYQQLLKNIATHRVADCPDRFEPRMAKLMPKNYNRLMRPRREIKLEMLKRFSEIEVPLVDPTKAVSHPAFDVDWAKPSVTSPIFLKAWNSLAVIPCPGGIADTPLESLRLASRSRQ